MNVSTSLRKKATHAERILPVIVLGVLFSAMVSSPGAGLFMDVPGLSVGAQNSLVAHYDGRTGVATSGGNAVDSWTPVDGNGTPLPGMIVTSTQRGSGAANLITYDGGASLSFDDTSDNSDGRFLSGNLVNGAGPSFTVFWKGHYNAGAPFETAGTYAYNIGLEDISHQRDNSGPGFIVQLYNGTTYDGDDITAFDGTSTIWSTVVTASSHVAYANGTNLNVAGSPTYSVAANADIAIGAFGPSGFDFVGDIDQMVIFESALSDADRMLVATYLAAVPEPSSALLGGLAALPLLLRRRRHA